MRLHHILFIKLLANFDKKLILVYSQICKMKVVIFALYMNAVMVGNNIFVIIKSNNVTLGNINQKDITNCLLKLNGLKNINFGSRFGVVI